MMLTIVSSRGKTSLGNETLTYNSHGAQEPMVQIVVIQLRDVGNGTD